MDIKIGVFVPVGVQFLDISAVDLLGVMSKEYLLELDSLPTKVTTLAPSVTFYYISTPEQGKAVPLSSGASLEVTHSYNDPAVAPGQLDIVIVPGPLKVGCDIDERALQWLRSQFDTAGVDILSICTGVFVCAAAGITENKQVCGPRGLELKLRAQFPGVVPAPRNMRWIQQGNLWSSGKYIDQTAWSAGTDLVAGGVANGIDLVIGYSRTGKHWHPRLVDIGLKLTEVADRGQFYDQSAVSFMSSLFWDIARYLFVNLWDRPREKKN